MLIIRQLLILSAVGVLPQPHLDTFACWLVPDDELRAHGPNPGLRTRAGLSLVELMVVLTIVGILLFALLTGPVAGCGVSDDVKGDATQQAKQYATGMGYQDPHVQCVSWDSDGYVSCTVSFTQPNGTIGKDSIECAAGFNLTGAINEGCRTPKIHSALPQ